MFSVAIFVDGASGVMLSHECVKSANTSARRAGVGLSPLSSLVSRLPLLFSGHMTVREENVVGACSNQSLPIVRPYKNNRQTFLPSSFFSNSTQDRSDK